MNPKIKKLEKEIEKNRQKVTELQTTLRELEQQKTELENTDIVAIVRSFNLSPQELAEFIQARKSGGSIEVGVNFTSQEERNDEN